MKRFFSPNIGNTGRLVRGTAGLGLLVGAWVGFHYAPWVGIVLLISSIFVLFEAARGWCVMRACGIKTKL